MIMSPPTLPNAVLTVSGGIIQPSSKLFVSLFFFFCLIIILILDLIKLSFNFTAGTSIGKYRQLFYYSHEPKNNILQNASALYCV